MYFSFPPLCATRQYAIHIHFVGMDSSVGIETRYGFDGPGIDSRWRRDYSYPSRPALSPTLPPVQWVLGFVPGSKGVETYENGSKIFRPDQLCKVTEIEQFCSFSIQSPFSSTPTDTDTLISPQMALYIPRSIFHLARQAGNFCIHPRSFDHPPHLEPKLNKEQTSTFFQVVHPLCVLRSQVLGYGKYTSQTQLNFINIKVI